MARSTKPKDWRTVFLCELATHGNVCWAARKAGISRRTAYEARDPKGRSHVGQVTAQLFAEAWRHAVESAYDLLLGEARRRAVQGHLEPVFYKGRQVGAVRRYSDELLMLLLRIARPDKFGDHVAVAVDLRAQIRAAGIPGAEQLCQEMQAIARLRLGTLSGPAETPNVTLYLTPALKGGNAVPGALPDAKICGSQSRDLLT